MAWYSGRNSIDPQISLASGAPLEESSAIFHVEGQFNQPFADDRGRVVLGASYRNYNVNTEGTLMMPENDDRSDDYYSGYGQVEFRVIPQLRLVAAARVDDGTLFETQLSPKGAIVFTPHQDHSFRATINRAFQTPNYSEFFLRAAAGAPTSGPDDLETNLETYFATVQNPAVVGPQLAAAMAQLGLPTDVPWNFNQDPAQTELTPVLALGNADLEVEKVTGWEFGYKGSIAERAYVSVDFYYNQLSNFVTDLLPGVNQNQYPSFALDSGGTDVLGDLAAIDAVLAGLGLPVDHPLRANNALLRAGYQSIAASPINSPALATVNGQRAIVVSYANAGQVDEYGVEFGVGFGITPELRIDASYTYFDFDVDEATVAQGDRLLPNSAKHKGGVSLSYTGQQGFDASVSTRFIDSYEWAAGIFAGTIPSRQDIDVSVGYRINNYVRGHALVSNLLDQERFQQWGGSVIGRRILGGITATF
jgi:outer membrane receptor protein involved in Fe transport